VLIIFFISGSVHDIIITWSRELQLKVHEITRVKDSIDNDERSRKKEGFADKVIFSGVSQKLEVQNPENEFLENT